MTTDKDKQLRELRAKLARAECEILNLLGICRAIERERRAEFDLTNG